LLVEIVAWSGKLIEWQQQAGAGTPQQIAAVKRFAMAKDKGAIVEEIKEIVRRGGHYFEGVEQPSNPRPKRTRQRPMS
jgi:hypothetical protein